MIDTVTGESLRVRMVEVYCSNLGTHEYTAIFGGVSFPFYPEQRILDVPFGIKGWRKVLLSGTTKADDIEVPSVRSRVVGVEERPHSNTYTPCKTP